MAVTTLSTTRGTYLGLHGGKARAGAGDAIGIGATNNYDFDVSDFDGISVLAAQTASALGDIGITVQPFDSTGAIVPVALTPAVAVPTNVLSGGNAYAVAQFDVRGIQAIRVAVKNNNAAAKVVQFVDVLAAVTGVDF